MHVMLVQEKRNDVTFLSEGVLVEKSESGHRLKRVKLLGYESQNNRIYVKPEASLYEGAAVNLNHPSWMSGVADVESTIGIVQNVTVEDSGVWGDIVLNPEHRSTKQILWVAENAPKTMGMSHVAFTEDVEDQNKHAGPRLIRVMEVVSVDIVGRPATTKGLFEQEDTQMDEQIKALVAEVADLKVQLAAETAKLAVAEETLRQAREDHEATKQAQVEEKRNTARLAMLAEAGLSEAHEAFVKAVKEAVTDEDAKALIESVATPRKKAKSTEQVETSPKGEVKDYDALLASGAFNYKGA